MDPRRHRRCRRLIRIWRVFNRYRRRVWRWLRNERGISDALGRLARLTGFIVMVSLLLWHFWQQMEELCRLIFK
jgi:hypothetical protein